MTDDTELLRRYAEEGSEDALAQVVGRRVELVYGAAWRQVRGNGALAEEITQAVFTELARKAGRLARHPALVGWLHTATRFAAAKALRAESRRRAREREAFAMNEVLGANEGAVEWEQLRPVIDDALGELKERERAAILLRYFEKKPLADVGAALALTETAARSCVDRALDKLRAALARQGITSTTAALSVVLANQAAATVPAGLAASVTSGALAGGAVGGGVAIFMGMTKLTVGLLGAVAVAGIGAAWWGTSRVRAARVERAVAQREEAGLAAQMKGLESRVQAEAKRVQAAEAENARLLAEAEKMKGTKPRPAEVEEVTSGMVNTRFKRALELAKTGDPAEALRELLWCFDVGMPPFAAFSGVRVSVLLDAIVELGARYPAALDALRARRDEAREQLFASDGSLGAGGDFASINRVLKDYHANLALFDQLAPGDRRRRWLASGSHDLLVEQRRYTDALEGSPYTSISSTFEMLIQDRPLPPDTPNPEELRRKSREYIIAWAVKNIEVLAGAGEMEKARTLAARLMTYDAADATRALIQRHAERAGRPELLAAGMKMEGGTR